MCSWHTCGTYQGPKVLHALHYENERLIIIWHILNRLYMGFICQVESETPFIGSVTGKEAYKEMDQTEDC